LIYDFLHDLLLTSFKPCLWPNHSLPANNLCLFHETDAATLLLLLCFQHEQARPFTPFLDPFHFNVFLPRFFDFLSMNMVCLCHQPRETGICHLTCFSGKQQRYWTSINDVYDLFPSSCLSSSFTESPSIFIFFLPASKVISLSRSGRCFGHLNLCGISNLVDAFARQVKRTTAFRFIA
jgi:hypothetical protein